MCFINFSNHSSVSWGEQQREEAQKWGDIIDVAFPMVDSNLSGQEVEEMAGKCVADILRYHPSAVMCQGEFTLSYHVVSLLKEHEIPVLSACSKRNVMEEKKQDGTVYKRSVFRFIQFREY